MFACDSINHKSVGGRKWMYVKKYASKKVIIFTENINLNSSIILIECFAVQKSLQFGLLYWYHILELKVKESLHALDFLTKYIGFLFKIRNYNSKQCNVHL